jgi:arylsulfatase A-like enzyme
MIDGSPPGELGALVVEQYDRAIRNLDAQVGQLLERLQTLGLYDDTLIVVTSDHGEYFGEHQLVEHSKDVYQPVLEVPLIVKYPGQTEGEVVETRASLVDVPRMILAGLSSDLLERYGDHFHYALGAHPILAENHFSRPKDALHPDYGHRFRRVRTALMQDGYKLIHSTDGNHELYRLEDDPDEVRDQYAALPERAREMSEALRRLQAHGRWVHAGDGGLPLSAEQMEALRELGYAAEAGGASE